MMITKGEKTPRNSGLMELQQRTLLSTGLFLLVLVILLIPSSLWAQSISLVSTSGMTVTVSVDCGGSCTGYSIDWGDLTALTDLSGTSPATKSHTYSTSNLYCIQVICFGEPCNFCGVETGCNASSCLQVNVGAVVVPTISISSPADGATLTSSPASFSGSASGGVTSVTWTNNTTGGSGTATDTTSWTASIPLQSGSNSITVTAHDAATNTGSASITVTYSPPDTTVPTISISSPSNGATLASSPAALTGSASDNVAVTSVTWSNTTTGASGNATGTTSWTASIPLQSGSNSITVTAHDAATNTGSDSITVTYMPPSGAFSVTPTPTYVNIVPDQNNVFSITYKATDTGGGTYTVSSSQGLFETQGHSQLGITNQNVSINIHSGSGTATETVTISPKTITAALKSRQNPIYYRRTFTDGSNTADSVVTLQIVPFSAGIFSLARLELGFIYRRPSTSTLNNVSSFLRNKIGRATVPENSKNLKAAADISYNGSGFLRAQWKVDGQILGYVTRFLYPGIRQITIESPSTPALPTYDTGRHSVEMEILEPTPLGFDEPIIYYYVTSQKSEGLPGLLRLISPEDNARVPMPSGPYTSPEFQWQEVGTGYTYTFEVYGSNSPRETPVNQQYRSWEKSGTPPLITARTALSSYALSRLDLDKLSKNVPYTWHVQAVSEGKLVAASVDRTVLFSPPPPEEGKVLFEYLDISDESGPVAHSGKAKFSVIPGQAITIKGRLKNGTNRSKQNIWVEFLVDGKLIDTSFVSSLLPGNATRVRSVYIVPDSSPHTLELRALQEEGKEHFVLARIKVSMGK